MSECPRPRPNEIQILGFIYDLDTGRVQFLQKPPRSIEGEARP